MKQFFKPLGIAAAVAAATAGQVNVANAQPAVASNGLGDLALVPYYTVNGDWITGIHIVNTSDNTQVVKFRFRRAADSMDALDFNIVMSPKDVYAGFISDDESGNISWSANDTTCTIPATTNGRLTMPNIYREGAETGYVEIIAMGQPDSEAAAIAVAAKHAASTLTPLSCDAVRSNFFAAAVDDGNQITTQSDVPFNIDNDPATTSFTNNYVDSGNVLKVSYFIRDNASGVEFGDNAVHIENFIEGEAAITNQEFGYFSGDLNGFDFPDIDGGTPTGTRGRFALLRDGGVLGVDQLINEWTANTANGAALDWVVTLPGQYAMFNILAYFDQLADAADGADADDTVCARTGALGAVAIVDPYPTAGENVYECDFRDIPVTASFGDGPWNREELAPSGPSGQLVVSPQLPGSSPSVRFDKETNVITFGGNSVLGVSDYDVTADLGQPFGWLTLSLTPSTNRAICAWPATQDIANAGLIDCSGATTTSPALIGFAAWARSVAANPDASYGRIIGHSTFTAP